MAAYECYHCKQWIGEGQAHDCWTTTEAALTRDLSEDLRDAWERLRETAVEFGEQRIYASHHSIMFARKTCYFFVRPKTKFLEVCVFLPRTLNAPQVRTVSATSKTRPRIAHMLRVTHRDEVEAPITNWLREAYDANDPARKTVRTTNPTRAGGAARQSPTKPVPAGRRARKAAARASATKTATMRTPSKKSVKTVRAKVAAKTRAKR